MRTGNIDLQEKVSAIHLVVDLLDRKRHFRQSGIVERGVDPVFVLDT